MESQASFASAILLNQDTADTQPWAAGWGLIPGAAGCVFVHANGFIGGNKTYEVGTHTREADVRSSIVTSSVSAGRISDGKEIPRRRIRSVSGRFTLDSGA